MSQAGGKWNPVEGLREIYKSQIKKGDLVIVQSKHFDPLSQDMDWQYMYKEYVPYMRYFEGSKFFLLKAAPMVEPSAIGSAVYYKDAGTDMVAIKLRPNIVDYPWHAYYLEKDGALTPEDEDMAWMSWKSIMNFYPTPYTLGEDK